MDDSRKSGTVMEVLVVRTFAIDVSNAEVLKELPWKIGRLFPWLFSETAPVCFLGLGRGWRGWKKHGSFSSYALLKAITSDAPVAYHINRVLAWITNFIDVVRIATQRNSHPVIVLAHTPQFGVGASLAKVVFPDRVRFVVRVIGNDPSVSLLVRRSRWRFKVEQALERFVVRRADVVLPMGNYTYDLAVAYGVDPRKIVVLPFPVRWFQSSKVTDRPTTPTVLFCGRLIREKGVHILLEAMKVVSERVRAARLVIVGDTDYKSYRSELEELVDGLGISDSVSFLGWIPNDRMEKLYRECSLLVIPSIWEEGLGMVMIEAGLLERPVIGSDLGGIKEFIQNGINGLLVPPGNSQALAEAISSILEKPLLAAEMGKQNRLAAYRYLDGFEGAVREAKEEIDKVSYA